MMVGLLFMSVILISQESPPRTDNSTAQMRRDFQNEIDKLSKRLDEQLKGMIAYFKMNSCPPGWSLVEGLGNEEVFILNGGRIGEKGGSNEHSHKLTIPSLSGTTTPNGHHNHLFPNRWYARDFTKPLAGGGAWTGIDTQGKYTNEGVQPSGDHSHSFATPITSSNSEPSSNMPPFIRLLACQKN